MSTFDKRDRDFRTRADADVAQVRRGGGVPVVPVGYKPGSGSPAVPIPGDTRFPFFKDPPDVEGPIQYVEPVDLFDDVVQNPIPLVTALADYTILDAIDVGGYRLLTLFVEFFPGDGAGADGVLSIVPEQGLGDQDVWMPVGVVEGTLTTSTTVAGGAYREAFATELRVNQTNSGVIVPASMTLPLDFDVTTKATFRFRIGDVVRADSGLNLWYTLGR